MRKGCYFLVILSTLIEVLHSQLLHPIEHVTGRWDINLYRKDQKLLNLMVFPPQSCSKPLNNEDSEMKMTFRRRRRRNLNCELILDPNGTFTLNPPVNEAEDFIERKDGMLSKINRLPLKGYWKLKPNPYCVTDRHFDELVLMSNPKTRVNNLVNHPDNNFTKEKVVLEMHCKVWGRFGSNTIRNFLNLPRAKDARRLTHGTLSIRKDANSCDGKSSSKLKLQTSRRVVCATFRARSGLQGNI